MTNTDPGKVQSLPAEQPKSNLEWIFTTDPQQPMNGSRNGSKGRWWWGWCRLPTDDFIEGAWGWQGGEVCSNEGTPIPGTVLFDVPYGLGITVGTDAEMTPRQPIAASAYALQSANASALAATATVAGSQITNGSVTLAKLANCSPEGDVAVMLGGALMCRSALGYPRPTRQAASRTAGALALECVLPAAPGVGC